MSLSATSLCFLNISVLGGNSTNSLRADLLDFLFLGQHKLVGRLWQDLHRCSTLVLWPSFLQSPIISWYHLLQCVACASTCTNNHTELLNPSSLPKEIKLPPLSFPPFPELCDDQVNASPATILSQRTAADTFVPSLFPNNNNNNNKNHLFFRSAQFRFCDQ